MKQQEFNFNLFQVAEIELTYQSKTDASNRPVINSSAAAYEVLSTVWHDESVRARQQFNIVLLNRANRVLGIIELPLTDISKTVTYQKTVYVDVLKKNAVAIIIGLYHPQDLDYLRIDEENIANELKYAGSLLDIKVLDCISCAGKCYTSLADQGLL